MKKKKLVKSTEPIITDILEEYFIENGVNKVKKTYMSKDKVIKEEVVDDK